MDNRGGVSKNGSTPADGKPRPPVRLLPCVRLQRLEIRIPADLELESARRRWFPVPADNRAGGGPAIERERPRLRVDRRPDIRLDRVRPALQTAARGDQGHNPR